MESGAPPSRAGDSTLSGWPARVARRGPASRPLRGVTCPEPPALWRSSGPHACDSPTDQDVGLSAFRMDKNRLQIASWRGHPLSTHPAGLSRIAAAPADDGSLILGGGPRYGTMGRHRSVISRDTRWLPLGTRARHPHPEISEPGLEAGLTSWATPLPYPHCSAVTPRGPRAPGWMDSACCNMAQWPPPGPSLHTGRSLSWPREMLFNITLEPLSGLASETTFSPVGADLTVWKA